MPTIFVTFAVGGPLRNYYIEFLNIEEQDVHDFCAQHFPLDWAFTYQQEEFVGQPEKHSLKRLCVIMSSDVLS